MSPIAPHITAYLRERLPLERRASRNTCDTYAYAFQLLFAFAGTRLGIQPSDLQFEQLDAPLVTAFLEHLQTQRANSPRTRNLRLAAIKSFMHFMEYRLPSALDQVRRVLACPTMKTDGRIVHFLSAEEQKALLDAPDPRTRSGTRDRALCHLAIAGGLLMLIGGLAMIYVPLAVTAAGASVVLLGVLVERTRQRADRRKRILDGEDDRGNR